MSKIVKACFFVAVLFLYCIGSPAQKNAPATCRPFPSDNQMRWQQMQYYAFVHFSLNTYADQTWGYGNEDINLFNPTKLDCRQWARTRKNAGMKGIILTVYKLNGLEKYRQ